MSSLRESMRPRSARPKQLPKVAVCPHGFESQRLAPELLPCFQVALTCNGRPGGIRTPNIRFWRPALYRWSYWPNFVYLAGFFMNRVAFTPLTVLLKLDALRIVLLVLVRRIVTPLAVLTRKCHECSHKSTSPS